jgi:hypothetical protein
MVLTAEEYSKKAAFHEKAADNQSVSREGRILFARKANWLRILARIAAETRGRAPTHAAFRRDPRAGLLTEVQSEALLFSPRRLWAARGEFRYSATKKIDGQLHPRGHRQGVPMLLKAARSSWGRRRNSPDRSAHH